MAKQVSVVTTIFGIVTDEEIKKALEDNDYNISAASRQLKYSKVAKLRERIKANPELEALIKDKPNALEKKHKERNKTDEEFIEAIYQAKGIRSVIAKTLELDLSNVYQRIKNNPHLQEHMRTASEGFKDVAEFELFRLVEAGNFEAIKFYLSRQAKDRGYGEKIEFTANVDVNNNWNLSVFGVEELLALEALAQKALPEGGKENDVIEGRFAEIPTESLTN